MISGIVFWIAAGVVIIAFLCEYIDSTLGMGYGTTLVPLLLLFGFTPQQIVPSVLFSELITGLLAAYFHHRAGNVDFSPAGSKYTASFDRNGFHLQVALLLAVCSTAGAILAVLSSLTMPKHVLQSYIGVMVVIMGIIILVCRKSTFSFSWIKIAGLGLVASFNKGLTGGGYGPLIVSGQILSGVRIKNAIGITSLAEGLTCLVGLIAYRSISASPIDWRLAPIISIGAVLSVPFAAKSVKKVKARHLRSFVGVLALILGVLAILKAWGSR